MSDDQVDEMETARFKVSDRRKFTSDGDPIESREKPRAAEPERGPHEKSRPESDRAKQSPEERSIDFGSFLLSLATSAMAYLGDVPDPATGQTMENLEGAQQMIDILTLLQEKTEGNLEPDEERLLDSLLYELRMKYLSKAKVIKL